MILHRHIIIIFGITVTEIFIMFDMLICYCLFDKLNCFFNEFWFFMWFNLKIEPVMLMNVIFSAMSST